jgi:hypothetical protein
MNREELEAVIWRHVDGLAASRPADRYNAMGIILGAVSDYTTAQCAIAIGAPERRARNSRRAELEIALAATERHQPRRAVHYDPLDGYGAACHTPDRPGVHTSDRRTEVTCHSCRRTSAYRDAA